MRKAQPILPIRRELTVTDLFGFRNLGVHSGLPGGARALPVPTSVLADEKEQVQDWAALIQRP